ncbi:FliM/FliN family flagellar motor switch protein, partial [Klebsiella variicola]
IFPLKTEYVRSEIQVKFTNITSSPNDIVVTTPFYVEVGSHSGEFDICIPFSMIEPIRELLMNPPLENSRQENTNWRNTLAQQVKNTELELVSTLVNIPTRLSDVLKMKKDDIISFDKPDLIEAAVDGVPVLSAKYGCRENQYALQVENLIPSALLSFTKE